MALYVVATPIGNMEDMTYRAVNTLRQVDAVVAEDTRTYRNLATRFSIPAKPVYSLYKGNESARADQLLPKLQDGLEAALISESGTPAVSDPGALLVRRCLESGVRVIPIPGPSTLTAILSVAGIFSTRVAFLGFLPKKNPIGDVVRTMEDGTPVVFFENARRAIRTFEDLAAAAPRARLVVGREMTKKFEEIWNGPAADAPAAFQKKTLKGELAVAVDPAPKPSSESGPAVDCARALALLKEENIPLSSAVRILSKQLGASRRVLYAEALKVWKTA